MTRTVTGIGYGPFCLYTTEIQGFRYRIDISKRAVVMGHSIFYYNPKSFFMELLFLCQSCNSYLGLSPADYLFLYLQCRFVVLRLFVIY